MTNDDTRNSGRINRRAMLLGSGSILAGNALVSAAQAQTPPTAPATSPQPGTSSTAKPNIVFIWGDDIGISDLSCYSFGMMGYRTPTSTGCPEKRPLGRLSRRSRRLRKCPTY
jgi:hypothetical protein